MKAGAASGARAGQGALCRRPRRRRHRRDAGARRKDAAEKIVVDYEVLPAVVDIGEAQRPAQPQVHDGRARQHASSTGISATRRATDAAFASAAARRPSSTSSTTASCRTPWSRAPRSATTMPGTDSFTLYTTSQNPHVARLVLSAFIGLAPEHKLRVIAPDVGGGFGSKIFIYAEETVCVWAAQEGQPAGEVDLRPHRGFPRPTRMAATTSPMPNWRSTQSGKILGLRVKTQGQSRRLSLDLRVVGADLSLRAAALRPVRHPGDLRARSTPSTPTPRPSTPIAAPGRPEATFVVERMVEVAARELGQDPAEFRRQELRQEVPAPDAGHHDLRRRRLRRRRSTRRWRSPTTRASAERKREAARNGKLRGIGFSAYIEACGIAPSAAVGSLGAGVGLWESAEVRVNPIGTVEVLTGSHSHGQGHETTFAQLVSDRLGIPIDTGQRSSTATPTRCSSAWAPTARAPARSACRRSPRRSTR